MLVPTLDVVVAIGNCGLCIAQRSNVILDFPSLASDMYNVNMDTLSNTL